MDSLRVETTLEDLVDFSFHATLRFPTSPADRAAHTQLLAWSSAPVPGWMVASVSHNVVAGLLVSGLIAALMFVIGGGQWEKLTRQRLATFARLGGLGVPGPSVVTLEDAGVLDMSPNVSSRFAWSAIEGVEDTGPSIAIRLAGNRAIVLPKRGQVGEVESFGAAVSEALATYRAGLVDAAGPVEQADRADAVS